MTTHALHRHTFNALFGFFMIGAALFLLFRREPATQVSQRGRYTTSHTLIDAEGTPYLLTYNPITGGALSVAVGDVSSLLGIGGGIIHVPAMVYMLHVPLPVATATSHCTLAVMAWSGTLVHVATGAFHHGVRRTIALGVGVLVGTQLRATLSHRVHGTWILRSVAVALGLGGVRILLGL